VNGGLVGRVPAQRRLALAKRGGDRVVARGREVGRIEEREVDVARRHGLAAV
jgi:hypothetical protein